MPGSNDVTAEDECRESEVVERHLLNYLLRFDELRQVADEVQNYIRASLEEQAIQYHLVEARPKSFESYRKKSLKRMPDGALKYQRLPADIDDCVAARVIVYTEREQYQAVEEFRARFLVPNGEDRNPADERTNRLQPGWGYNSHHFVVSGIHDYGPEATPLVRFIAEGRRFELQVRTVAAHAWAEYEHDVRYKPERLDRLSEKDRGFIDGLFMNAAEARQTMDQRFTEIERILSEGTAQNATPLPDQAPVPVTADQVTPLSLASLKTYLALAYPEARQSADTAVEWMLSVLDAVDITSEQELTAALDPVDSVRVAELMAYGQVPTRLRRLDDDLLSTFGSEYVDRTSEVADSEALMLRRIRYLPARQSRLEGKLRIYSVLETGKEQRPLTTAAGALRELIQILVTQKGPGSAEIPGIVSASADEFGAGARATLWEFASGESLWVNRNLTRAAADEAMAEVHQLLEPGSVTVYRSGDEVLPGNVTEDEDR